MTFSYHMQSSKLLNSKTPTFNSLNKFLGIDVFEYINSINFDIKKLNNGFISKNYSNFSSKRMYFSQENGFIIDKVRMLIDDWYSNELIKKKLTYLQ